MPTPQAKSWSPDARMALYGEPVVVVSDPRLTPVMVSTVATVYAELQPQVKDEKGTDAQEKVYALGRYENERRARRDAE